MIITIEGATIAPTWTALQSVIMQSLDTSGKLTRINRDDKGVSYRDKGTYTLTFTPDRGDETIVKLIVK